MKKFLWAASIAAILFSSTNAQAGSIAVEASLADGGVPVVGSNLIDIRITYEPSEANHFWGGISFSLELGGGVTDVSGWIPAEGQYEEVRDGFLGKPHWTTNNVDTTGELRDILIQPSPSEAVNRRYGQQNRPAEGAGDDRWGFQPTPPFPVFSEDLGWPTLIGQVEVDWDGTTGFIGVVPGSDDTWTTFVDNGDDSFRALTETDPLRGNQLDFGGGEPSDPSVSISATGTGDVTLDGRGATLTGLDLDTAGGVTFAIINQPGEADGDLDLWLELTGIDGTGLDGLVDKLSGGGVTASRDAGNPFLPGANLLLTFAGASSSDQYVTLSDLGDGVRIDGAAIPEPSTFVLTGLALVGMFGCGWRRRRSS